MKRALFALTFLALAGCVKETDDLNAGPVVLKVRMEATGTYAGPYCAVVTLSARQLKASKTQGFWYWGTAVGTSLDSNGTELGSSSYAIEKFDGSTPAGSYSVEDKPFPVLKVGANTSHFRAEFNAATFWGLDRCAGCIGMESFRYKPYNFPYSGDGLAHECGYTYKMVFYNELMP